MSKLYHIEIAVPLHIAKFIHVEYGEKGITFHQNHHEVGLYLMMYSQKQTFEQLKGPNAVIKIGVKRSLSWIKYTQDVDENNKMYAFINKYLTHYFNSSMVTWIAAQRNLVPNTKINASILSFLHHHHIEDELDPKSCYQVWHRHINEKQNYLDETVKEYNGIPVFPHPPGHNLHKKQPNRFPRR